MSQQNVFWNYMSISLILNKKIRTKNKFYLYLYFKIRFNQIIRKIERQGLISKYPKVYLEPLPLTLTLNPQSNPKPIPKPLTLT